MQTGATLICQAFCNYEAPRTGKTRLAYVAATRGIRRVIWHTTSTDGALNVLKNAKTIDCQKRMAPVQQSN